MLESDYMYVEIIGIIVIFVALRALVTKNRAERLLYLNVIGFGVSAIIALVINTPFALIVAAAFFICSTISANAIAYTLNRLNDEILLVLFKYLDVALFAALAGPLSTLVFILSIVKIKEIRTNKIASGEAND